MVLSNRDLLRESIDQEPMCPAKIKRFCLANGLTSMVVNHLILLLQTAQHSVAHKAHLELAQAPSISMTCSALAPKTVYSRVLLLL